MSMRRTAITTTNRLSRTPSLEPSESPKLRDMTRRLWIGTSLTVPLFLLERGGHLTNLSHVLGQQMSNGMLLLGTPVVLWASWPCSMVGTLASQLSTANLRMADGTVAICFEAAAVITGLLLLGQRLELRVRGKRPRSLPRTRSRSCSG